LDENKRAPFALLAALDKALAAPSFRRADLKRVLGMFNDAFSSPPVETRLLAWGTIADIIGAETYSSKFDDYAPEDFDEDEPESLAWIWTGVSSTRLTRSTSPWPLSYLSTTRASRAQSRGGAGTARQVPRVGAS